MRTPRSGLRKARSKFAQFPWPYKAVLVLVLVAIAISYVPTRDKPEPKPPTKAYSTLLERISDRRVRAIEWDPNTLTVKVTERKRKPYVIGVPTASGSEEGLERLLGMARENKVKVSSQPVAGNGGLLMNLLRYGPGLAILILILFVAREYLPFGRKIEPATSDVTFDEVAGCGEAIDELRDVRAFLADPARYEAVGARVPKGVLLHGPPGTGKTLLAKAVANEAGIPFYSSSGSEFVEMYAGLGAKRVRKLFEEAKKHAPSIIFIDELDAVGGKRSSGGGDGGTREADQTLIQILKEMDGFDVSASPVIVMGATNRLESLDGALTRPGRFDRHIAIDPPDWRGRHEILKVHAKGKPLGKKVKLKQMARHSSGMAGAELSLWLNEAALLAARRGSGKINRQDIDQAFMRIVAGAEKQYRAMSDEERRIVAYHEAGHALVRELLRGPDRVHKISIIPRGKSGGQTVYTSDEDVFLHSEPALRNMIRALLAGRAAEELIFDQVTSGAGDDLNRATDLAYKMLTQLGMGDVLGLRVVGEQNLSPNLVAELDDELRSLLSTEYQAAMQLLVTHRASLGRVAEKLLEEETIDRDRFLELAALPEEKPEKSFSGDLALPPVPPATDALPPVAAGDDALPSASGDDALPPAVATPGGDDALPPAPPVDEN